MSNKDSKEFLVPRLRFPEFLDAGEWEEKRLGEICEPVEKKVGNRKLLPISISAGIGFVPQSQKFGRDISGKQYSSYILVRDGDFVYNKGNSTKFPQGCIYELKGFGKVAAPNVFFCFRFKKGFFREFYSQYFETNVHGKYLKKYITSGARSNGLLNIGKTVFFETKLPTPSQKEQQRIADCLSSLDDLIAAESKKLETYQQHKKGLMQQLFPTEGEKVPRLRFPEFREAGEWEEESLEDLTRRGSGHTPNKAYPEYYDGGIKWVSLADSKRLDAGLITETAVEISAEGIANSSAVLHPAGAVLLSRDAAVGKSAVMGEAMAVSQHFIVWTCKPTRLSNWFLYYSLQQKKPKLETVASGSTIKTIGLSFFIEMRINAPTLLEQEMIASCLLSIDDLITAQRNKAEKLRAFKSGLMQQLFPSMDGQAATA